MGGRLAKKLLSKAKYRLVGAPEVTRINLFESKLLGFWVLDFSIVLQWGDVNLADFAQVPRVKAKFTEAQPR